MRVQIWGFEHTPYFGLPIRAFGYVVLALAASTTAWILYRGYRKRAPVWRHLPRWHLPLLATLLVVAPVFAQTFLVRVPHRQGMFIPGIPLEPSAPLFGLLAALPWMLAAGVMGIWEATLVALLAGFARGGWGSQHLLTPFLMALEAAFVAWLLRRDYEELPGRFARSPAFSSLVGGTLFGVATGLELFCYSGGSVFDGLDYAAGMLAPILLAALVESGFPGALGESLRWMFPEIWFKPERLVVGPYNRSLTARLVTVFLLLGVISGGVLLYGDWVLAQRSARELVEREMGLSARQLGESVPYFIQTGRMLSGEAARNLSGPLQEGAVSSERLQEQLRLTAFFVEYALYGTDDQIIAVYPEKGTLQDAQDQEFASALRAAGEGFSEEVVLAPHTTGSPAELVFITPVLSAEEESVAGVLAGISKLTPNPLLQPALANLDSLGINEAYLTDENGTVLLRLGQREPDLMMELDVLDEPGVRLDTAPDGSRQLLYTHHVSGYPWSVIIATPFQTVQRQAFEIASRLFGVVVLVGAVLLLAVYAFSARLTEPLRSMSSMARSIAKGHLAQPIPITSQDEIGQLSVSFERMRRSLKDRLEELELLLEVSNQIAASFDLGTVLPPILEGVRSVNGATLVRLVLRSEQDRELVEEEDRQAGFDPGGWSHLDGQILELCRDRGRFSLENPSRAKAVLDLSELREPIEALSALPILHQEEFVGVLWLGHRSPQTLTPDDLNLLTILAGQLGVAIGNGRLYQRAQQERTRLTAVLDVTPDAVVVIDRQGRIVLVNPSAERLLGWRSDEVAGQPAETVIEHRALRNFLLERGQGGVRTEELEMDDEKVLFASVSEIDIGEPGPSGRVCVLWDVSHYKKLDALKTEFVSTVSHDLRAPLTLMRGYATMLHMVGDVNQQQRAYIDKMQTSLEQMGRLIDNLLDLSRIEAGMGLNLGRVNVGEVVSNVVQDYRPRAENKQLTLDLSVEEDLKPIEADEVLLRQAIGNLLDNGIRFTPSGGQVEISVKADEERLSLHVTDTGVGIAPMDQARLFEKFYHGYDQEDAQEKGLGLGLAIVKSIADRHHGRVHVDSRLGEGSTFVFEIPLRQPRRPARGSPPHTGPPGENNAP